MRIDNDESEFTGYPTANRSPSERLNLRGRIGIGATIAVLGAMVITTSVGLAHADETTTPSAPSSIMSQGYAEGSETAQSVSSSITDKIGLVSISQVTTSGALVPNSVIQVERRANDTDTSDSTSASTTATQNNSTTTQEDGAAVNGLSFPVGANLDVITSATPVILALPEGVYKLTHLGTAGTDNGPNAGDVTIRVAAGHHVAGKLLEQPGTTRGAAPGITTAATTPTPATDAPN
ncbi:hypothetical protein AAFP35_25875 [Gordonia sp. CPCC 206044]|uniref:hypothetical protein n=1 Tax=Gordonia sp. CPCC 206044 TaxID=3140793 RepID=UPI003AF38461